MRAEVHLEDPQSYVRLLHGFWATHNPFSHDRDRITFVHDDDGVSLELDAGISHVSFGPAVGDSDRRAWAENLHAGDVVLLLLQFMRRDYARIEEHLRQASE
jgi:hypothetical protein